MPFRFYRYTTKGWVEFEPPSDIDIQIVDDFEKTGIKGIKDLTSDDIATKNQLINNLLYSYAYHLSKKYKDFPDELRVLFWFQLNLRDRACYQNLVNQFFINNKTDDRLSPILNIGTFNFYGEFIELAQKEPADGTLDIKKEIYERNRKSEEKINKEHIAKYYRFLDFSIWCRYLYVGSTCFNTSLDLLINKYFKKHYENGLYQSAVAHEFINLHSRLLLESFIRDFGTGSNHSKNIVPFSFQSETELISYIAAEKNNLPQILKKKNSDRQKIKLLLWDDKGHQKLNPIKDGLKKNDIKSKKEILEDILNCFIPETDKDKNVVDVFEVSVCEKITDGSANQYYDIILTDFLLENKLATDYLLSWLSRKKEGIKNLSDYFPGFLDNSKINHKLWIFPVSSFNIAFNEKLAQLGFEYFSKDWVMSDGADFINTPNAFRYKFYEFLEHLENETGHKLFRLDGKEDNKSNLIEYLCVIFGKDSLEQEDIRWYYPHIVKIHSYYLTLQEEKEKKDGYTQWAHQHIFNNVTPYFMEHLVHLMYFLSYASKVQQHQMLEESRYLETCWPPEQNDTKAGFFSKLNNYILSRH